ncbi:type III secretion system inner membrane ring lipoprotein SctJ [Kluyvera intermedia]|uniref:Lipoprotein n=1 Tax=Kluyvera intermedia TaxID=61648 RepID=A0ABX6DMP9_KLUIN|nr:type III secretion inner membrane ring lipoprotein SctJ [Kluyvera intermedia]QGH29843.1 EscJ/YscJ/HrcJ family type III secretion inner membrane ring protein [Kluyvera intermedia]QGH38825.1 EscJ/YscJ/HrcJ family type III secretion inner membrane ring protein [Kluyvera intermedia]
MSNKYIRALAVVLFAFMLSACNDEKLLFNLTQEQANQVLAILQQHNITANKEGTLKAGYTVAVNKAESTAALSIINQYQLPWTAEVQIAQAFPEGALVSSPNAEQARVLSLQEQRLEQSLRMIAQVVNARVHVSYPAFNNDSGANKPTGHVGVMITYKGEIDDNLFISQIKSLIKNSFDDVRYENISVVLFPAPMIQYVTPTNVPDSLPAAWVLILVALALCGAATSAYMLYRVSRRPPANEESATEPYEPETVES